MQQIRQDAAAERGEEALVGRHGKIEQQQRKRAREHHRDDQQEPLFDRAEHRAVFHSVEHFADTDEHGVTFFPLCGYYCSTL